ncbi:uncharacterized protein LOC122577144 isoform X1 [Bombus pyrosoma]|uniref:uncharacterized protein LOC122577144 isoform X1 n=1 Tax=Bombus pyrosoma TaxID=396416 RepID=UPI001CB8CB04|nr:uncharacterized protein LOC122577144 isoform X1 [Bombus pyrosoma]XP_043604215.1 uncharacterized protein LOC122577144 isoform X1 [Bombus pyrosoma]
MRVCAWLMRSFGGYVRYCKSNKLFLVLVFIYFILFKFPRYFSLLGFLCFLLWVQVMLVMDMELPAFVQPVQHERRRDSKNVWMAREDDTDDCAKAHFPEETSAGVLDVLLCRRSFGFGDYDFKW